MGQAWCKDKSAKAQDSKSPLDRVFVRCAHRIYPGLKEEGSVLGGATQRVTSSEIGYAGSPPRAALLRGRSIDSVDRPFHPSEWVDVNLEVPCTPRASVVLGGQRRQGEQTKPTGRKSPGAATLAPVPPPRRRRRRERRPLPPKPGSGGEAADDESEPEPLYSKLGPADRDHEDSDEEFATVEHILEEEGALKEARPATRPKNHSATSLPNVADLLAKGGPRPEDEARRPPGQAKSASLPRDGPPFPPQNSERAAFARGREEGAAEELAALKDRVGSDLGAGFKTSTPMKTRLQPRDDDLEGFKDESGAASSANVSATREPSRRDEDTGYESRIESQPFSDVSRLFRGSNELSSGILRADAVDSFEESDNECVLAAATVQRTISEESLPREMLVELDEEEEQQQQQQLRSEDEKSNKGITRNGIDDPIDANVIHDLDTPPPSPALNCQEESDASPESKEGGRSSGVGAIGNATSMMPSLIELEVALTDMLEKKDELEREAAEDKSSDKLPVPQIAALEDVEEPELSRSRLIDFPRADRTNPFNDFKSDDHEPPEKPSRLHRISLMEEPVIEESKLVPTPPRRRHRSKSNLNTSSEALHTYGDRLI